MNEKLKNGRYEDGYGIFWYRDGLRHREDGPACMYQDGTKQWWLNGAQHRLDGPAVIFCDGSTEWWSYGMKHRLDGPAVERRNGYQAWYKEGQLNREDGPVLVFPDGTKYWSINGNLVMGLDEENVHPKFTYWKQMITSSLKSIFTHDPSYSTQKVQDKKKGIKQ